MDKNIEAMAEEINARSRMNSYFVTSLCIAATKSRAALRWASECELGDERKLAIDKLDAALAELDHLLASAADDMDVASRKLFSALNAIQSAGFGGTKETHNQADPAVREAVLNLTGGRCAYCDAEIRSGSYDSDSQFCVEHVVPKSCGGPDHLNNYVPACKSCNNSKGGGHVLTFIKRNLPSRIARAELKVVNGGGK